MRKNGKLSGVEARDLYDRLAEIQNLAMRLNGYRASVAKYLQSLNLKLPPGSLVLDAGSGTGLVTRAFRDADLQARRIISLDLSINSLKLARESLQIPPKSATPAETVQANVLAMPFADNTFDLLLMCGVLEYTPLEEGLGEAARVLKQGAPLVFLPVKPSVVGSVLQMLYNFKIHPLRSVRETAARYFDVIGHYEFPITEPIAWSKTIFLLEKR